MTQPDASVAARQRAVRWLARREYSVAELTGRLARSGYDGEAVSATIEWLLAHDLVSDRRFAEALVRSRAGKGYGPRWIEQRLRVKGLEPDHIRRALTAGGHDWRRVARRACRKRFGDEPWSDLGDKSRRHRFLRQRGFTADQIEYALARQDHDDEDC